MKILGAIRIGSQQQLGLEDGTTLVISADQFRHTIKGLAHIGDLAWLQEPYCELKQVRGGPSVSAIVPCHFADLEKHKPDHVKGKPYKMKYWPGEGIDRKHSRATLEIIGCDMAAKTITCRVHMQNIDAFAKARAA